MKKKYLIPIVILISILLLQLFLSTPFISTNKKSKNDKVIVATFLVGDASKFKKGDTVKKVAETSDQVIAFRNSFKLEKKNGYYETSLDSVNDALFKNVSDYIFSYNNYNGEVINDGVFDKKDRKIKIPEKYYEESNFPIQFELLSLLTKDESRKVNIDIEYNKIFNKKISRKYDANDNSVSFTVSNNKNLKKENISILLNDSKTKVDSDYIEYNQKTGLMTINMNPLSIKNIRVLVNDSPITSFVNNIINIKQIFALSYGKMEAYYKELDSIDEYGWNGSSWNKDLTLWYYDGKNYSTVFPNTDAGKARLEAYNDGVDYVCRTNGSCGEDAAAYHSFILDLSGLDLSKKVKTGTDDDGNDVYTTYHIKFKSNTYVSLFCIEHSEANNVSGSSATRNFNITVKAYKASKYIAFEFRSTNYMNTQIADGVIKFDWTSDLCDVKVTKRWADNGAQVSHESGGVKVTLYADKECTDKIKTKTISSGNDTVSWKNLEYDDYSIKETNMGSNSAEEWTNTTGCKSFKLNASDKKDDGTCYQQVYTNNRRNYYCLSAQKKDAETGAALDGFKFSNGYTELTTSGGIVTWTNLPYGAYTLSETSADGDGGYWNDSVTASRSINVTPTLASDLMTYTGNTWTDTPSSCNPSTQVWTKTNHKQYYCLKVRKVDVDSPSTLIPGASFKISGSITLTKADSDDGANDGFTSFYLGTNSGTYSIEEVVAPEGYEAAGNIPNGTAVLLPRELTNAEAEAACLKADATDANGNRIDAAAAIAKDTALVLNWYKVAEDRDKRLNGAKFKVYNLDTKKYITVTAPNTTSPTDSDYTTDANGTKKLCYRYSSENDTGTEMVSMNVGTIEKNGNKPEANGEVCVRGLPKGNYRIEETLPAIYHTFGNTKYKNIVTSSKYRSKTIVDSDVSNSSNSETGDNTYINNPTGFRFTKSVKENVDGSDSEQKIVINGVEKSIKELNTEELMKLDFEIYAVNSAGNIAGSPLSFIKNETTGIYEFSPDGSKTVHGTTGAVTTILHLNDKREISVDHLPWNESAKSSTYAIREVQSKVCDSTKTEEDCIGYYYPNYSNQSSTFTITPCSYDKDKVNSDSCPTKGFATQDLVNTPTLFEFTKSDFYGYDDQADIQDKDREKDESEVKFENAKEVSDFDRIDFRVKDSSGNYVNFIYVGNSGPCTDQNSYSIYKYVPELTLPTEVLPDVFNDTEGGITQTVHACGGHIHFTNLCRGNTYTIYEEEVPADSVYVREEKQDEPKTSTTVKIPCTDGGENEKTSTTAIISDKPTYFEVQKRDSKYNYLIPDDTATFRLYQCEKETECHPTDLEDLYTEDKEKLSAAGVRKVIKFYDKSAINGNQEASKNHEKGEDDDEYALLDIEVYRAMSDSDIDDNTKYVTDVHPDRGRLVFRYLQSGYSYVLVETVAPKNYTLPIGRNAETKFTVTSTTVDVEAKDTPNVPTSLLIRKYNEDSTKLLAGAEFKIYEAQTTCNYNQEPWAQTGLKEVKLKTIRDGVYEARPETDTSVVKTCLDKEGSLCNEIPTNTQTRLTDLEYAVGSSEALEEDTWADFENILYKTEENGTTKTEKVNLQEGEALIQYLEYGHCYVIEETKAPTGYSLPNKKKDRFTMVQIEENEQYGHDTGFVFKNTPTPFTFYKYDEFNELLDGAEFKLQKLNDDKKYEDIKVTEEEKEAGLFYKYEGLAKEGDNTVIHTKDGKATVYYLPAGQYRIVETKAAPGKELTKNPNIATFFVDEAGNTFGNAIVVNKPETKKIIPKNSASAELIVNIQTGQIVMKYGAIILTIIGLIIGLMMLRKKTK